MPFHIRLLGSFAIHSTTHQFEKEMRNRERALLAYVATAYERRLTRSHLAGVFWPDKEESVARNNLSQVLHALRLHLREHDHALPDQLIHANDQALWLNTNSGHRVDVIAFLQQTEQQTVSELEYAVTLYRGEFLEDLVLSNPSEIFEEWQLSLRERCRLRMFSALQRLSSFYLKTADYAKAREYALRQLALEPSREFAYRQLMLAFALDKQRNDALRQYQKCCDAVMRDFGAKPQPETDWLYEQIFANAVSQETINEIGDEFELISDRQPNDLILGAADTPVSIEPLADVDDTAEVIGDTGIDLGGIIDVNQQGLSLIRGYDLWFTGQVANQTQIWRLDGQSGVVQPVHFDLTVNVRHYDQFAPALSPDGAKIVFALGASDPANPCNRDLYLADVNGMHVERLTNSALDAYHPSWSHDGKYLAYHMGKPMTADSSAINYSIWVMNMDTRATYKLTDKDDYDPVWSPEGYLIAYQSADPTWGIKVLDFASYQNAVNSCRTWTAVKFGRLTNSPAWINNHRLVFAAHVRRSSTHSQEASIGKSAQSTTTNTAAVYQWDIYEIPIKPGKQFVKPIKLTNNDFDNLYPAAFQRKLILWQAFPHECEGEDGSTYDKNAHLYVMDLQQKRGVPLLTGIGNLRDGFIVKRCSMAMERQTS